MPEHWLLIEGGNVIDGVGNPPKPQTDVLVKDDRIVQVGDVEEVAERPPRERMQVLDARGKTVMPGLIDAHCHMTYGESFYEEEIDLYTSPEMRTLLAAANAEKVLRAGVTSISQPGGSYYIGVGIRDGIRAGLVKGPRMTTAGRYLTTSNGLTDWYPDSVGVPEGSIGILANTLDDMKVEVRHQVKNGADLIKLADSPFGEYQAFTTDEMKGVTELAHQLKRDVTIHARGSAEVSAAVEAGVDWIMHGNVMSDETIERLADSGIPLVPTLLLLANIADWPHLTGSPRGMYDGCRYMLEETATSLHKAREAGVRFAMGTDTGFAIAPYGEWHARELELLSIYAGLSPLEAIQAGTSNAARMMGREGELGEIYPGTVADVIVVDGDPSKELKVLLNKNNIEHVIKGGTVQKFTEGIESQSFRHNHLPNIYSHRRLTYDMVFSDGATPVYQEVPWTMEERGDLLHDLTTLEATASQESGL